MITCFAGMPQTADSIKVDNRLCRSAYCCFLRLISVLFRPCEIRISGESMFRTVRKLRLGGLAVAALAFAAGGPSGDRVLSAQGRPDLEALNQRLLPVFELAGVVFTDADEIRGRVVVGVLDRDIQGLVRASAARLGLSAQDIEIVETDPIFQVTTLRDSIRPVEAGYQIRFSQYVCSLGFNAIRSGVFGFVTASHCSTQQGSVDGTQYYQPLNQVPAELIGTETVDPPYVRNGNGCPKGGCAAIRIRTSSLAPTEWVSRLAQLRRQRARITVHWKSSGHSTSQGKAWHR
jgi:hypothetical protein